MTTQATVVMDPPPGTAAYEPGKSGIPLDPRESAERNVLAPMQPAIGTSARHAAIMTQNATATNSYGDVVSFQAVDRMNDAPSYSVVDLKAYRTLEQRAPQFLIKHFGRDVLQVLSLVLQHGHTPVLSLDDEGTLELEVRLNPNEILLLSVTQEGTTDALVHTAPRGFIAIASTDMAGVVRFLGESQSVSQVKVK